MSVRPLRGATCRRAALIGTGLLAGTVVRALPPADSQAALPEVLVIGTTALFGPKTDVDKIPGNVQSVLSADLQNGSVLNLTSALDAHLGSVSLSDTLADPFQLDVLYRGFSASPVLGTPQGLAVYQNGVRVNEAFGDSVNWDLIPDLAISRVDVVGSSPLYGLNALGGAVAITMKNGFTDEGERAAISTGSFGQRAGSIDGGFNRHGVGVYGAVRTLDQDGWRRFAHDRVRQYYFDVRFEDSGTLLAMSYSRAVDELFGPGAAPVQSLAVDPRGVFTGPQATTNNVDLLQLTGSHDLARTLAVQALGYYRAYRQSIANGNVAGFTACEPDFAADQLCQPDGRTPLVSTGHQGVPDLTHHGALIIGQNNLEAIHTRTWGTSLQFSENERQLGHLAQGVAGATLDESGTDFTSRTELGLLTPPPSLLVLPSALFVDTPEGSPFPATPVQLRAKTTYYGVYATDTIDLNPQLTVTLSGRYNLASIGLTDQRGSSLNGSSRFSHFNPSAGATYAVLPGTTAFANFSVNNRAPTASEIECSNPLQPCVLPSSLAGDPPKLRQVVAHTFEVGARGRTSAGSMPQTTWNLSAFRTDLQDDIFGAANTMSTGFFENVGSTRRQGVEAGLSQQGKRYAAYGQYSLIDATFGTPLIVRSGANPYHDASGNIHVSRGDRLPGIPRRRLKAGVDWAASIEWSIGVSATWEGKQFYRGDESNQIPALPGFAVVALRSSYRITKKVFVSLGIQNVFDERYSSYGVLGDPTGVNAPGIPRGARLGDPGVDDRFQNPGAPRAVYGGINLTF